MKFLPQTVYYYNKINSIVQHIYSVTTCKSIIIIYWPSDYNYITHFIEMLKNVGMIVPKIKELHVYNNVSGTQFMI